MKYRAIGHSARVTGNPQVMLSRSPLVLYRKREWQDGRMGARARCEGARWRLRWMRANGKTRSNGFVYAASSLYVGRWRKGLIAKTGAGRVSPQAARRSRITARKIGNDSPHSSGTRGSDRSENAWLHVRFVRIDPSGKLLAFFAWSNEGTYTARTFDSKASPCELASRN